MEPIERDLVLVGGGHAVMPILKNADQWTGQDLTVTLISDNQYLYYSGMVPEYLGGIYESGDVKIDLQALCLANNVQFRKSKVVHLDPEKKELKTADDQHFRARVMVFDIGSQNPKIPSAERVSPTKPLHHIEKLAEFIDHVLLGQRHEKKKNLVIVGGGAAGVEIALNISARMKSDQQHTQLGITLIEEHERLLPQFNPSLSRYASDLLQKRGVDVRLCKKTVNLTPEAIQLDDGHTLNYDFVLWATGPVGQSLFKNAGLDCDKNQFLWVNDTLQHPERPWLFAAGDCSRIKQHPDLRKIGVHAVKQSRTLHQNVSRVMQAIISGEDPKSVELEKFEPYTISPIILSTGGAEAIWTTPTRWIHNRIMLYIKHWLDMRWIEQYQYPFDRKKSISEKIHAKYALHKD